MYLEKEWFHDVDPSIEWVLQHICGPDRWEKEYESIRSFVNLFKKNGGQLNHFYYNPLLYLTTFCQVWDGTSYQNFKINEPTAMATHLLTTKMINRNVKGPVLLITPRQSGKTSWLVYMAALWNSVMKELVGRNRVTFVVTKDAAQASHLRQRTKDLFPDGKMIMALNLTFTHIGSPEMEDLLGEHHAVRGTGINHTNVDLFLDEYEFFPECELEELFTDPVNRNMIVAGTSTLKLFKDKQLSDDRAKPNFIQFYFDNVCTNLGPEDHWIFYPEACREREMLLQQPVRIVYPGDEMESLKGYEGKMISMLGYNSSVMNTEFYMRREVILESDSRPSPFGIIGSDSWDPPR